MKEQFVKKKKPKSIIPVFLILISQVNAIECPQDFEWQRMSGVGCVQKLENCEGAKGSWSYTQACICRDKKGCFEPVDYEKFDKTLCGNFCPYSKLIACVDPGTPCPNEKSQASTVPTDTEVDVNTQTSEGLIKTIFTTIEDFVKSQGKEDEDEFICDTGLKTASKGLDDVVDRVKRMKAEGKSDREIADYVVDIVEDNVETTNNFWHSPWTTFRHHFISNYQQFFDWRDQAFFDHDTMAIWAWNNGLGQCEENAAVTYYILNKAGLDAGMFRQEPGDHIYVILNPPKNMNKKDSRRWGEKTLIVDSWQNKVLTSKQAYTNKYILNNGEIGIEEETPNYQSKILNIEDRDICWDEKNKTFYCRPGYKKKNSNGVFQGNCVKE